MMHIGAGILLLALAITSILIAVLIAVKPAADPANARFVKRANTVSLMQQIIIGIVILTGLTSAYMASLPLSQLWLWMSLMIIVFYSIVLEFVTKPARMAVAVGGSAVKVGMQVNLQVGHMLLLFVSFAFMMLKPV